jgi:outer membrane protein OmpA-like peptidoglycan-associated protein
MVGDKVILKDILFQTGYSYILKESIPVLKNIAKKLREKDNLYFTIEGHVCCTTQGRDALDKATGRRNLSLTRARYIYNYLARNGIAKSRMKFVGLKHKYPLGGDIKFDRRVEIEITYIKD